MCSHFSKMMENYQGDLADIVRASAAGLDGANSSASWQFPSNDPINYSSEEYFGDPFNYMGDPILQNMDPPPVSGFFYNTNVEESGSNGVFDNSGSGVNNISIGHKAVDDDHQEMKSNNIFSRMLQISPNINMMNAKMPAVAPAALGSPRVLKGPSLLVSSNDNRALISPSSSKSCLIESHGMQISSPRNTGIKRRKSQAKKVVCIPAPAPANSRSTGEVVPSDLWAWRKYGQKPIKGSPYPRGYYRCSSSKGCSARKQVERSRTDPNMLVITYTSEHNHPWPTQRNALAGSTRSQPSKNNCTSKTSPHSQPQKPTNLEINTVATSKVDTIDSVNVKEEIMADQNFDNQLEMDDADQFDEGFPGTYKPTLGDSLNHSEDSFFADLGEIEAEPLDLLFTQGFCGEDGRENKDLDPFSFYDWATNSNTNITASTITTTSTTVSSTTSYGESNRDS